MERWLSGLRRSVGSGVGVNSVPRVRIPPSPPVKVKTMPRLYKKISKRLAKKKMRQLWYALQPYADGELCEGSLIHTCRGYNEVITEITPIAMDYGIQKGWYLVDLDIETDKGTCSLWHCCTFPPPTREEILAYFQRRASVETEWDFGEQDNRLLEAVKNGEDPFDENGCVKKEFVVKGDS